MYDETGLGATVGVRTSLRDMLRQRFAAKTAKQPFQSTILQSRLFTIKPKISASRAPSIAITSAPLALPSLTTGAATGSAGTPFSAGNGEPSEETALPVAAPVLSPIVLLAVGVGALLLLGKKGR